MTGRVMLRVVYVLYIVMLSVIVLNAIMLNVVMLNVFILSVAGPSYYKVDNFIAMKINVFNYERVWFDKKKIEKN